MRVEPTTSRNYSHTLYVAPRLASTKKTDLLLLKMYICRNDDDDVVIGKADYTATSSPRLIGQADQEFRDFHNAQ